MPSDDSPAIIVARFLKASNYEKTLEAFIQEANLPPSAGSLPTKSSITLEQILEEKRVFDQSLKYSKSGNADDTAITGWDHSPAPLLPTVVSTLPSSSNLLHVSLHAGSGIILASAADRRLHSLTSEEGFRWLKDIRPADVDSPILSCSMVSLESVFITSMSGMVAMHNMNTGSTSSRRDHTKYVINGALYDETGTGAQGLFATAGWDARVLIYKYGTHGLGEPVAEITLQTNPESILFVKDPITNRLFLLVTRRDSTSIFYYLIDEDTISLTSGSRKFLVPAGNQNLAPHSNAWTTFSPSCVALCPTDPTLVAVATSSLPHMKLLIVRLLFPAAASSTTASAPAYTTQTQQSRGALAQAEREEAAIQTHVNTMAPQTPYSTPQAVWRPDGSGVWVNGDDGVIRGVERRSGKVVAVLKDGHEAGSKVRSIWAGWKSADGGGEEWLISGGFDKRLVVWRPKKDGETQT